MKLIIQTKPRWLLISLAYLVINFANGQSDSITAIQTLEPVFVKATKIKKSWLSNPTSIYVLSTEHKNQYVQNSLQEFLINSPSIFTLNSFNKAQDLRIAIRGFGSRASFGVRGVKIIVDGIPETTTDGQGQLDNLNLGIIENIEVLNNGSSALYGNASGGVINISTIDESVFIKKNQFLDLGIGFYSFGGQQYQLTTGKKFKKTSLLFHANYHQANGFRDHSEFESTNFNLRITHNTSATGKLEAVLNYSNSPIANDPGGVDFDTFETTPTLAREANLDFDAGEAINQFKASISYSEIIGKGLKLQTYGFYTNRNFLGNLPFSFGGIIDLDRNFFGQGSTLSFSGKENKIEWTSLNGYEYSSQRDNRTRFFNLDGQQGATTLAQDEQFSNFGGFSVNNFTFNKVSVNLVLRYDFNQIQVIDQLEDDQDSNGEINLNDFNYSVGIGYQLSDTKNLFFNHSTSFETPTLNELSNNPDGSGFNPNLRAQTANHFEIGIKGYFAKKSSFQTSLYYIDSKDELLPFELEEFPGRNFFRNIGNTNRIGFEVFVIHPFNDFFKVTTNWSFQNFTFGTFELDGENFENNKLPGLPNFQGNIQLEFQFCKKMTLILQNQFFGEIYTDDANTVSQSAKAISNVSYKYIFEKNKISLSPYVGVNNIFQTTYADNIRINAFGGRFFESAPDQLFLEE